MSALVKLVVFVPEYSAEAVRRAMGDAGAGRIGNYTHCSFSVKGTGRFVPGDGAHPAIGAVGKLEAVAEERIEVVCERDRLPEIIKAIKDTHPYEEVPIDVYRLLEPPKR